MSIHSNQEYLKCIGGPRDGFLVHIYSIKEYKIGDHIKIPEERKSALLDLDEFFKNPTTAVALQYHIYRIAVFSFNKDHLYYFLVPHGWTDKQAILHQFGK